MTRPRTFAIAATVGLAAAWFASSAAVSRLNAATGPRPAVGPVCVVGEDDVAAAHDPFAVSIFNGGGRRLIVTARRPGACDCGDAIGPRAVVSPGTTHRLEWPDASAVVELETNDPGRRRLTVDRAAPAGRRVIVARPGP